MLIGLISDTHIPDRAKILPQNVIDAFKDVDLISFSAHKFFGIKGIGALIKYFMG